MLMESRVNFRGPQNISGASQQNSAAAITTPTKVDDLFLNLNKQQNQNAQNGSMQLIGCNPSLLEIPNRFEKMLHAPSS